MFIKKSFLFKNIYGGNSRQLRSQQTWCT